ncbi:peptidyl-prolyl cis-trans isomerase [Luteolibacter flavescens]|uniref:Peptidyl-prolyl cis-trans isomerase n=1 Tax=Luteolibacter flavescens TaxID=1859460 RepID=A0ABT3FJV5_9BACT|nr:peptidyl-prolyl cis-trans isomerase [Luteolibacter flavescens]MCW1883827.1 peptidyl-prolyl cis-trans isomerase [Luteolibacter flavescens]
MKPKTDSFSALSMQILSLPRTVAILATVCLLGQCKKPAITAGGTPVTEDALATVAGQAITAKDLLEEAAWRQANRQAVPSAPELLKEMADRLALVEKAKQAGIADDPETRRRIQGVIIAQLREKELDAEIAKVTVSDEEVKAAYDARSEEFARKGLDRFAILFQAADAKASDARKGEARKQLEEAVALSDAEPAPGGRGPAAGGFGQVAAQHSEDQVSRYRGGDVGWIESDAKESRLPANVLEAGRALENGKRSGILEAADGFYVIMKTDARPGGPRPMDEVAGNLQQQLVRDKRRAIEERFLADAVQLSKVSIDAEAAAKVTLPVTPVPAPAVPELSPP